MTDTIDQIIDDPRFQADVLQGPQPTYLLHLASNVKFVATQGLTILAAHRILPTCSTPDGAAQVWRDDTGNWYLIECKPIAHDSQWAQMAREHEAAQ